MLLSCACVVMCCYVSGLSGSMGGDAFGLVLSRVHAYACDIQEPLKSKQPVDLCVWYCAVVCVCVCVYKQAQAHTESAVCLHDTCVNTEGSNKKQTQRPRRWNLLPPRPSSDPCARVRASEQPLVCASV